MPGSRFPRSARLLLPREFDGVFQSGRRERGRFFVCVVAAGATPQARIGFAVGKKHLPNAHDRNLVKRIAREIFRRQRIELPAMDLVVRLNAPVAKATRAEINLDLLSLLQRLPRQ